MTRLPYQPDSCTDCGTTALAAEGATRCPACFEGYLFSLDTGFLDNYRKYGCRAPVIVAEACLRSLVLATPEHRKVLASTIFQQYVQAMSDLAGIFVALGKRDEAPVLLSFMEFRLEPANALSFFEAVQSMTDVQLCAAMRLPLPGAVAGSCPHLDERQAYSLGVAIYHLVQDLRRATDTAGPGALALADAAARLPASVVTTDVSWLNGAGTKLTPDQVAMVVLDARRQALLVQGISAEEAPMGQLVDAIETATRASSNLIFAYLETNSL